MVFVVVFDVAMCLDPSRSATCYEITEHWLKNIATYAIDKRTPPIILVGSHLDQVSSNKEKQEEEFIKVLEKLQENPQLCAIMQNHVQDMVPIADLNDSTINKDVYEAMWETLIDVAPLQSQWQKAQPARWVALEHELVRLKNRGKIILTYEELLNVNRHLPVPLAEIEVMDFLRALKFAGSFLCFDLYSKNPFAILQPQWVIDAFKAIMTAPKFKVNLPPKMKLEWTKYEKTGVLSVEFLTQLWKDRFLDDMDTLNIVMETLSLLAKPVSDDPNVEVDYFIVPSMLQTADPQMIQQILDDPNTVTTVTLCLMFKHPFIPQAVWDKMIASCIHRFQRLKEPEYDGSKFIQRGFASLTVDALWNTVINCRDNAMKITMFKRDTDKLTKGAGINLLKILHFLIQILPPQ
ncbi:probable serine/threonine-protein kinase pats1 [Pecten maximus]|uniref:probable serine/threonine-protein kinase pats1 n=1 Tax=Pecten maximus TaxID=6579 RepID=UPI001458C3B3|nr:probable serine/threonine-protein kinase pats1 [Pecten maximus]